MTGKAAMALWTMTAAAASAQTALTPQQAFNAGEAAYAKKDWAGAADNYRAALKGVNARSRSAPVIHARLATALYYKGDDAAARAEAESAIALFGGIGVAQNEDLAASHLLIANLARGVLDSGAAIPAYRRAIAAAAEPGQARLLFDARTGLALAAMTSDPAAAAAALDEVIADPGFAALPKPTQADVLSIRARAELNRGDAKSAARFMKRALDIAGRTTTRVTLSQVAMRGDAALIYARLGDHDQVRQFLTYSGAGHLSDNGWLNHTDSDLPLCGSDIRPDDMAVVQFAIDDAGRTLGAAAVYASRPGPIGDTFARSVRAWRWAPAEVKKLSAFWRSSVRVELRCVTRPPGIRLIEPFRDATEAWLRARGVEADLTDPTLTPDAAASTPAQRVLAALVIMHGEAKAVDIEAKAADLQAQLAAADATADVRAYAAVAIASWHARNGQRPASQARLNEAIAALQMRPDGGRAAAWLRTEQALRNESSGDLAEARAALTGVVNLPAAALPAADPIRTVALLHLSLIDKLTGQASQADSRLAAAGMTTDQCSLLDVQPLAKNMSISSTAFPTEALRWGFEGTVREAFDINADGSVAGVRTVIAYPPLVFGTATEAAVQRFRYAIPTLGDKPLGCAAQTVNVRYIMPK